MRRTDRRARLFAVAVVAYSVGVAVVWMLRVPMFQEPDELAHFDYVAELFDVGHPFADRSLRPARVVAPETQLLASAARYRRARYDVDERFAWYGGPGFFARIDRRAAVPQGRDPRAGAAFPINAFSYPAGFYALAATVMRVAYAGSGSSLVAAFFAARAIGVVSLAGTLVLARRLFRLHGLGGSEATLGALAVGALPLTSWVAGYVQPDNLAAFLFTAALVAIRLWQRRPDGAAWVGASGLLAGALCLVKQQYGLAVVLVLAGTAASIFCSSPPVARARRSRLAALALALGAAGFWLSFAFSPTGRLLGVQRVLGPAAHSDAPSGVAASLLALVSVTTDAFFGEGRSSFWFGFGFNHATIYPTALSPALDALTAVLTSVTLAFVAWGSASVLRRLRAIAKRRSLRAAVGLGLSSAPFAAYAAVTGILLAVATASRGALWLDGRYWLPVLPAAFLVVIVTGTRFFAGGRRRTARRVVAWGAASGAVAASAFGLGAIDRAFYEPAAARAPVASRAAVLSVQSVGAVPAGRIARGTALRAGGYAIDSSTGFPASRVDCDFDRLHLLVRAGLPSPDLARRFNDDAVGAADFAATVPATAVTAGHHSLRCAVVERTSRVVERFPAVATVDVP